MNLPLHVCRDHVLEIGRYLRRLFVAEMKRVDKIPGPRVSPLMDELAGLSKKAENVVESLNGMLDLFAPSPQDSDLTKAALSLCEAVEGAFSEIRAEHEDSDACIGEDEVAKARKLLEEMS